MCRDETSRGLCVVEAFGDSYVKHLLARLLFVGEERNQISKGCKGEAGSFNVTSNYHRSHPVSLPRRNILHLYTYGHRGPSLAAHASIAVVAFHPNSDTTPYRPSTSRQHGRPTSTIHSGPFADDHAHDFGLCGCRRA